MNTVNAEPEIYMLSSLVKELKSIIKQHGDLPVCYKNKKTKQLSKLSIKICPDPGPLFPPELIYVIPGGKFVDYLGATRRSNG